ncbi:uncharacterized protein LOC119677081 [Teleopsis dalmanni]|uniref:uncharacterized protein LOC119677081 n=1 Tax=Teleopsis dalmanni TaxID=139649 RepID=UPI0018CD6E5A|nr:uncharacterized protein LOC119677081 [Teleopsis dalmanni]
MPHRTVYRKDKTTTKMRIVFDASSSEAEHGSLNEFLSPGDNLLSNLVSILLRFRSKRIAMTADIEKAFLQIAIDESDRDTHRFLWYVKMPSINEQLPNIVEMHDISVDLVKTIETIASLKPTKQSVMKALARIYDPLGIIAPFTVRLKILLQNIWKVKYEWDAPLNDEMCYEFEAWRNELKILRHFKISRCLCHAEKSFIEIHIFADASPKAYGVVAYLRTVANGIVLNKFICSKNRVSPITKSGNDELSLPKLELTAAVIAVRLKAFLSGSLELQIDKYYLWSDSTITLNWIMGCGNKIKPYVTTRVKEILKLTNIYEWKYCDGKSNPADFLTRGCTAKNLFNNELWKNGPSWLSAKQIHSASNKSMNDILLTFSDLNENIVNQSESFETINKYSNIKKVLRVTAYIMKFISNMQTQKSHRTVQKTSKINDVKNLSAQEIAEAEKLLVKLEQRRYFPEEASYLKNGKILPTTSKLLCLNPTIDDGVIRLSCRISDKDYDKSLTKPAILPKLSRLSRLLIIEAHTVTLHGGVNVVLAYIRKKYWIIQGRQLIKNIVGQCIVCKRIRCKSANEQWSVLPTERITTARPFKTTGIDFAGPLYIKIERENYQEKVYINLFTCVAIRAIHLELVRPKFCIKI